MYFVKLTNQGGNETYVNLDLVTDLVEFVGITKIYFGNADNKTIVKETPEEILNLVPILES